MRRAKRNLLTLGAIGFAILLFALLGIIQTQRAQQVVAVSNDLPEIQEGLPTIGGAFELVDKEGKPYKDTDFHGKPMLVYFGYTYCPDICPTALSHMTEALEALGGAQAIQPIFITVDPHRDTLPLLQDFAQNYHKDFIMLTGTKPQIDEAIKAYRVHAARTSEKEGEEDYLVDHSSLIYLMDKDGYYRAHFNHLTPSEDMVKRVRLYLEKEK